MMRISCAVFRPACIVLATVLLPGCLSYRLSGSDLLEPNSQLAARGETAQPGRPMSQADVPPKFLVKTEVVQADFGDVALTRVESEGKRPLIVFCGGSAFRQDVRGATIVEQLRPFGDVWTFDYPGYGRSQGAPDPLAFQALNLALARRVDAAFADERTGDLVFWGHSFGGGVCAKLAATVPRPSSLVLTGAFRDYRSVVKARAGRLAGPFGVLVKPVIAADVPDTDIVETLRTYPGAVIVTGSRDDAVVPFSASASLERQLRSAGRRTRLVSFPRGDHGRFLEAEDSSRPALMSRSWTADDRLEQRYAAPPENVASLMTSCSWSSLNRADRGQAGPRSRRVESRHVALPALLRPQAGGRRT